MKLGEMQRLTVVRRVDFGVYLAQKGDEKETVLLPAKQVPTDITFGDTLDVFIYRDSSDRLIATTNIPKVMLNQAAALTVKDVSKFGAFLDWGLEKDLFLPYKEMNGRVRPGDQILIRVYIDKSKRLCASMKGLYHCLSQNAPYRQGDQVTGRIYEFGHDFGTFVAVDDRYSAMIPRHEDMSGYRIGQVVQAHVTGVKEDGKLDLSVRKKAWEQLDEDAKMLLELLDSYAGVFPFTEKASPEVILRETGLSKAAFKRAIGHLYKDHLIDLTDGKIRKKEEKRERL